MDAAYTLRELLNEPKELRRLSLTLPLDRVAEFSYYIFHRETLTDTLKSGCLA